MAEDQRHVIVAGAMGAGKTTVGRLLAEALGRTFHDSDETLEARAGETGADIARRDGVSELHALELEVFLDQCRRDQPSVIAPAASVVDHEAGRDAMAANITVWLTAPDEVLAARTSPGGHRRPVGEIERLELRARRDPAMAEVSALIVDTADRTPEETTTHIVDHLGG